MKLRQILIAAVGLAIAAGTASGASAETTWQKHHPRRVEVNHRISHLNHAIRTDRREGKLTGVQAHRLHVADRHVRMQERRMAARNGGHLTKGEQHRLNREENGVRHHVPS